MTFNLRKYLGQFFLAMAISALFAAVSASVAPLLSISQYWAYGMLAIGALFLGVSRLGLNWQNWVSGWLGLGLFSVGVASLATGTASVTGVLPMVLAGCSLMILDSIDGTKLEITFERLVLNSLAVSAILIATRVW